MSTQSKTEKPKQLHCQYCGYTFERKDAIQIEILGAVQIACPQCGNTRAPRTF